MSSRYPNEFYKIRKSILERDNHTCQFQRVCRSKRLVVHHIDSNKKNNVASNLITLCSTCHSFFHAYLEDSISGYIDLVLSIAEFYENQNPGKDGYGSFLSQKDLAKKYKVPISSIIYGRKIREKYFFYEKNTLVKRQALSN